MPTTFPPELIAALSVASVWPVTLFVNLLKPLVERIPGLSPNAIADKPAHDAALQLLNGVLSLGATLVLATVGGYVQTPQQFWVMGVQIVGIMLASDFNYRGSAKSSNGGASSPAMPVAAPGALATRLTVSPAQVADALNSAIQQAQPTPVAPQGQPNAVKQLADDAPAALLATQPALPAVQAVKPGVYRP